MTAGQATNIAMHTALDKAGVQDDITILVIDLVPNSTDRWVCSHRAGAQGVFTQGCGCVHTGREGGLEPGGDAVCRFSCCYVLGAVCLACSASKNEG